MVGTAAQIAVAALYAVLGAAALAAQEPRALALPQLAIDGLPPAAARGLSDAYNAARKRPQDPSVVGRLAMMLHAYEQHRAARECYRIAQQLEPRALAWTYLAGVVEAELGEHAAAAASMREALRIDPGYLPARIRLADALLQARDLQASRDEYAALARDVPELALAHYGLGRLASLGGDAKAAVPLYQRAVDLSPPFGAAHYALALAYRDAGLADRAAAHLEAYRRFGPRRPAVRDRLMDEVRAMRETARDFIAEAARLGEQGKLEDSIALHLKALEIDPRTAQAHVNLISLYGRTRRPEKAEEHYRAALALDGSLADAHYNYGVLLASARRHDEAAALFRKALEVDPFHASAHHNLASLLAQQRKYDEAAAHYRQALANDPQHIGARLNLGRVLALLGHKSEALQHFERALERLDREGQTQLAAEIRKELRLIK